MEKIANKLGILLLLLSFGALQSCQQECNCEDSAKLRQEIELLKSRGTELQEGLTIKEHLAASIVGLGSKASVAREKITLTEEMKKALESGEYDILTADKDIKVKETSDAEAAEIVASIFNSLMGAENTNAILDVNLIMSEDKVKDGIFLFSIQTEEAQNLEFTIYDEEGFETVANNTFGISKGENYKALNVQNIPSGEYLFKLRNTETNKELVQKLDIQNQ